MLTWTYLLCLLSIPTLGALRGGRPRSAAGCVLRRAESVGPRAWHDRICPGKNSPTGTQRYFFLPRVAAFCVRGAMPATGIRSCQRQSVTHGDAADPSGWWEPPGMGALLQVVVGVGGGIGTAEYDFAVCPAEHPEG